MQGVKKPASITILMKLSISEEEEKGALLGVILVSTLPQVLLFHDLIRDGLCNKTDHLL